MHGVGQELTESQNITLKEYYHEFENNILKGVHYEGFKLITVTQKAVMFKTFETVEGTDGMVNAQGMEILLEKEDDGKWHMVQQRILMDDETAHDQLLPQRIEH